MCVLSTVGGCSSGAFPVDSCPDEPGRSSVAPVESATTGVPTGRGWSDEGVDTVCPFSFEV